MNLFDFNVPSKYNLHVAIISFCKYWCRMAATLDGGPEVSYVTKFAIKVTHLGVALGTRLC